MTCIHENEINKTAECNLQHGILDSPKITNDINSHYSHILHA